MKFVIVQPSVHFSRTPLSTASLPPSLLGNKKEKRLHDKLKMGRREEGRKDEREGVFRPSPQLARLVSFFYFRPPFSSVPPSLSLSLSVASFRLPFSLRSRAYLASRAVAIWTPTLPRKWRLLHPARTPLPFPSRKVSGYHFNYSPVVSAAARFGFQTTAMSLFGWVQRRGAAGGNAGMVQLRLDSLSLA